MKQNRESLVVKTVIKKGDIADVFTREEFALLLDYVEDGSPHKVAFLLMGFFGLRPVELLRLNWSDFTFSDSGELVKFTHLVHKPQRSTLKSGMKRELFRTAVKINESSYVTNQVLLYLRRYGPCPDGKVFPWSSYGALEKIMKQIRRDVTNGVLGKEWSGFTVTLRDEFTGKIGTSVSGVISVGYRLTLYSLRRFCFTYLYYCRFDKDVIKLASYTQHLTPTTLVEHYVKSPEEVGLSISDIKHKVSMEDWVGLTSKPLIGSIDTTKHLLTIKEREKLLGVIQSHHIQIY